MSNSTQIECPHCTDLYCEDCGNTGIYTVHWGPWSPTLALQWLTLRQPFDPKKYPSMVSGGGSEWRVLQQQWTRRDHFDPRRIENEWRPVELAEVEDQNDG